MKIIRVALLVMALAIPVFADDIPYGVMARGEMQNDLTMAGDIQNGVNAADNIPYGITLLGRDSEIMI